MGTVGAGEGIALHCLHDCLLACLLEIGLGPE